MEFQFIDAEGEEKEEEDQVSDSDGDPDFRGFSDVDTDEEYHEVEGEDLCHGEEDGAGVELDARKCKRANAGILPKKLSDFVVGIAKLDECDPNSYKEAMKRKSG